MTTSFNRRRTRRRVAVAVLTCAGLVLTSACGSSDSGTASADGDRVSLMVDWAWSPYHAPFMYGIDKGIYADHGIDLDLEQGQGSGTVTTLVSQNKADYGFVNMTAMMTAAGQGVPVKSVLTINKDSMYGTVCHASSGWGGTAEDLKGRSVLLVPTAGEAQIWDAYLAINGLGHDDVNVVNAKPENKVSLFLAGRADCMVGLLALEIMQAETEATDELTDPTPWSEEGVALFGFGITSNVDRIAKKPDLTQRFVDATVESWERACNDTEGAMSLYAEKVPEANRTDEQKEFNKRSFEEICSQAQNRTPAFGPTSEDDWQNALDLLSQYAGLESDEPVSSFFTNDFVS